MMHLFVTSFMLNLGCSEESSQVTINSGDYVLDDFYIPAGDDIPGGGKYSQLLDAAELAGDDTAIAVLEAFGVIKNFSFSIDSGGATFGWGPEEAADLTDMPLTEKDSADWEVGCDTKVTSLGLQSFTFTDGSLALVPGVIELENPLLWANVEADDCVGDVAESIDSVAIREADKEEGYILYLSKQE